MSFNLSKLKSGFNCAVVGEVVRNKMLTAGEIERVCVSLNNIDLGIYGVNIIGAENDTSHVILPRGEAFLVLCNPFGVVHDVNTKVDIQQGMVAFPLPRDRNTDSGFVVEHHAIA